MKACLSIIWSELRGQLIASHFALLPIVSCLALVFFICPSSTYATNPVTEIHSGDVPKGMVALGAGWRFGDSPYRGIEHVGSSWHGGAYDLMPFYYYEGKWLFAHGSTAGIHLLERDKFKLDAVLSYRFDRLESELDNFFYTVQEREQTLESGLAGSVFGDWGELKLSILGDMMNHHNSYALDLTYRYKWHSGKWSFSPFASVIYHDSELSNYYYGVSAEEAREDLAQYKAGDAAFVRLGINTSYSWSKRMRVFANFSLDQLDSTVRNSPLVDSDFIPQAMLGFAYGFGTTIGDDKNFRRKPDLDKWWSWRINYGQTVENSFIATHQGNIQKNKDVDTSLLGLTLGRLILDGERADFWAKVSLNRRFEQDHQSDFFEINAYVMAMGSGYSAWSNKELFRYGFGFGFSYADSVPMVEQLKQQERGKNSSHFLNYLEAQLDFPLRNLFGDSFLKDCYAGLTLVHRSGIFGRVDIIGNVAGGSDVLSTHLECKR
ncbi:MipA/OmpV family protein [Parahaliea sp. F7430]|uniref:MipA/OmpV family protein n=1 Tax=Sediminihaliea albiluteola TaxID=2758564 RepID=A0A7W2YI31_9GAMM|nr:MipA/OmpV family protein [Sediminihaliea albiluteola]MBA6411605.1 MipA/OmpV family protein [Sediminihaliea albiluteola]